MGWRVWTPCPPSGSVHAEANEYDQENATITDEEETL